jgi:hypothetical protein
MSASIIPAIARGARSPKPSTKLRVVVALAFLASACSRDEAKPAAPMHAPAPKLHFTDVTRECGLDMMLTCGRSPSTQLPEVKGGGLALIDYDNDGDLDVFVPNGAYLDAPDRGPGCRMFENVTQGAGGALRFRDATKDLGLDFHGWGMGVAVGDVDGDGFDDIYVAAFGADVLLHNDGGKHFTDVTKESGLGDPRWSTAAAFGDLDGDGDLDLYVVNYIRFDLAHPYPPEQFHGVPVLAGPVGKVSDADILYENDGRGRFRDVSAASGIDKVAPSAGLGVAILDFDGDGKQDVFVGNDSMASFLFVNQGGLKLVDEAAKVGLALNGDGASQATMGIAIGDVNGDQKPDVFTTNFANDTNTLRTSVADGFFYTDRTSQYGLGQVSRPFLGWATGFFDFDLDGDEDLIAFNGHVYPNATRETMDATYAQTPLLFERAGGRFALVAPERAGPWLAEEHVDRSAAFGDLDQDGDVDIVVGGVNQKLRVLRGDASGPWLIVELDDRRPRIGNRHGLGARIVVTTGSRVQTRWITSGGSYQAASAPYAMLGIPDGQASSVDVRWPDGTKQHVDGIVANQHLVLPRKQ